MVGGCSWRAERSDRLSSEHNGAGTGTAAPGERQHNAHQQGGGRPPHCGHHGSGAVGLRGGGGADLLEAPTAPRPSAQVSGTGTDVKEMLFGEGQYRCTFTVRNNNNRYGSGTNIVFWLGGRLQVNEIEVSGTWTKLVDTGAGIGYVALEVEAAQQASWSVSCRPR